MKVNTIATIINPTFTKVIETVFKGVDLTLKKSF